MKYLVTGRIHPERAGGSFGRTEIPIASGGKAVASSDASQLTIALDVPALDGWISAYMQAEDVAEIFVGAIGFELGCGYSVELIQVTEEDGTPHVFGVQPQGKSPGETLGFSPAGSVVSRAFHLSGRNLFFRLALRDYLRAITDTTDCATYCFRAIESVKMAVGSSAGDASWENMHAKLNTSREAIDHTVKDFADAVRHGNWVNAKPTDKFQRWEMLLLTQNILARYLDYEVPPS